ncbi:putative reverse transcriptase domain-containing protein [Tanacetum coccineum]
MAMTTIIREQKSHVKKVGHDAAHGVPWNTLMKMMTAKYCPCNEIKKLEIEIRELKVKGIDLASYTQCFQELALLKFEDISRNNQNQQQQNKRHKTGRAYTARPSEKREYGGSLLKCSKCNYHYNGPCVPKCHKYNKGHFKRECRNLKNNNRGNQGGNGNAPAKVCVVGNEGTNPYSNVVTCMFLLNNRYASILFDTGADRSFVSTTFSSLIDITPTTLDYYYDVELADGKIIGINTIIRG